VKARLGGGGREMFMELWEIRFNIEYSKPEIIGMARIF